jgi:hypothetical protein
LIAPLLPAAIAATGLSTDEFARSIVHRAPRTVRAWLDQTREVPDDVQRHLRWILEMTPDARAHYVDIAAGMRATVIDSAPGQKAQR